ncbi:MAG TPA: HEAT repeat domain-containing protein [Fimbriimonadaceae bacterium]|nr:HEAT repeat domain-containing protein [Fimbriimonadaceae bacterium]
MQAGRNRDLAWLARKLQSGSSFDRWRALVTLGRIKDASVSPAIAACLEDGDARVREEAIEALHACVGDEAMERLRQVANRTDDDILWLVAIGLVNASGLPVEFDRARIVRAANLIRAEVADDRRRLALLLSRCPAELIDDLFREEMNAEFAYMTPALRNLVTQGSPAAIELIRIALEHPNKYVVLQALLALGRKPPPELVPAIERLGQHTDKDVRNSARRALDRAQRA